MKRNDFGAIIELPEFVKTLLIDAEKAGCWSTGIVSDKKNRGTSINTSVYGFDATEGVAVVQVRECQFRPGRYSKVRKDWYMLGRVESNAIFTHAIDSPIRSKLAREDAQFCCDFARATIWGCKIDDLSDIIRQGDIALIPIRKIPEDAVKMSDDLILRDTHKVRGDVWVKDGVYYTRRGTTVTHSKGEHVKIKATEGVYRIATGYRADVWGFSAPTID